MRQKTLNIGILFLVLIMLFVLGNFKVMANAEGFYEDTTLFRTQDISLENANASELKLEPEVFNLVGCGDNDFSVVSQESLRFAENREGAGVDNSISLANNELTENTILADGKILLSPTTYTVKSGDSMWKIASKYEIGLSELIKANSHIKNPAMIFVGQKMYIPEGAPLKTLEDEVIRLVNVERVRNGLQTLRYNWQASRVARIKSEDMISRRYFSHISPIYGSPFKMMEDFGLKFSAAAENIAKGQTTPQQVMNSWMNSPGHRANILGKSFTEIGVGAAKDANGTLHWTQIFLKPV